MTMSQDQNSDQLNDLSSEEHAKAAQVIQRTYRGHRTRRALQGHGLDADSRWIETVRNAKFHETTAPHPPQTPPSPARARWKQVTDVARRAGADDPTDDEISTSEASDSGPEERARRNTEQDAERQKRKAVAKAKRKQTAKMMDLQYFLEMVDHKHRYGSNLRKYHARWKEADTKQSFFYWLDQGDGKEIEVEECSRERLDKEQVRYLSREERYQYLVEIRKSDGKLVWAKNGEEVWTKDELYRDSVKGIVPTADEAPAWKHNVKTEYHDSSSESDSESDDEGQKKKEEKSGIEGERYVNEEFHRASGPAKLKHVSAGFFFNHMVRQSLKKGHKWIFVADTSFRLYIGYKQSGAFQHSSFLHGARILSAGLIKVKLGQLRRLSPLSGHYRPPAANFRAFVHDLEDEGCDMSHVSISRSYAVLVGLEGYVKTRRKVKKTEKAIVHQFDKVVRPEKVKAEEEAQRDNSKSAQREREYLEQQRQRELERRASSKPGRRLSKTLSNAWGRITGKTVGFDEQVEQRGIPGTGPEDGVPAPDGKRHFDKHLGS